MAKRKRRIQQRIALHFEMRQHVYIRVLIISVCVVVAVIGARMMVESEGEHKVTVKTWSGTPAEKYQIGLEHEAAGEIEQAQIVMSRLARLSDNATQPLGYGPAHLWMATDLLGRFDPDFLWSFPSIGEAYPINQSLAKDVRFTKAQRHLAHAVALNPEIESAAVSLAASYCVTVKRNEALEVLVNAVARADAGHAKLHIPLAHVLTLAGDDLALQERAWHDFSTLGRNAGLARRAELTDRIRYVISALILKKYENADVAIRQLEARFPLGGKTADGRQQITDGGESGQSGQVLALRMAYHYHRAIDLFLKAQADDAVDFGKAVDALGEVVLIWPECASAIDALSYIAEHSRAEKLKVKSILERIRDDQRLQRAEVKSKVSFALALVDDQGPETNRGHLEASINADPENADAVLRLVRLLAAEPDPDYETIEKLAAKTLETCAPVHHAELYNMLGLAQTRQKKWNDAVTALERSLSLSTDKAELHRLLAEVYQALGKPGIAEVHRKAASPAGDGG